MHYNKQHTHTYTRTKKILEQYDYFLQLGSIRFLSLKNLEGTKSLSVSSVSISREILGIVSHHGRAWKSEMYKAG